MAKDIDRPRGPRGRTLKPLEQPIAHLVPVLKYTTQLQARRLQLSRVAHLADRVPDAVRERDKYLPEFTKADSAAIVLFQALTTRLHRNASVGMLSALLGAVGDKGDKEILDGMLTILEGDELARASGMSQPTEATPVTLALACRNLLKDRAAQSFKLKPAALHDAVREVVLNLTFAYRAAAELRAHLQRCDAVLLQFSTAEWRRPYLTAEHRPILARMLELHDIEGDGTDEWHDRQDDGNHPFQLLVTAERANILALASPQDDDEPKPEE